MDLTELLGEAKKLNASDLHITVGVPPQVRVNGALIAMENCPRLMGDDTQELVESIMGERQKSLFEDKGEVDFSFGTRHWAGSGYAFRQREQLQQHSVW